ncbi:MAG: hypothetical protein OIF51_08790 [Cellvibrionaceae bacterium]|nr:hypothetical protein [Cellvibrionaceae bacterium]
MSVMVENPADYIQQCMSSGLSSSYRFCFEFENTLFEPESPQKEVYQALLYKQGERWRITVALLSDLASEHKGQVNALENSLAVDGPWVFKTVSIPKPWGQEIWYSAYEQRGVCHLADNNQQSGVPVHLWLYLFPELPKPSTELNLLKVLAPFSSPLLGELYFEMHEQKQEVYVVSHIDETAWPDGVAQMRFGFCSEKQKQFSTFETFKAAYLSAVGRYEGLRKQIDEALQDQFQAAFTESDEQAKSEYLKQLPEALLRKEQLLADEMSSFIAKRSLHLGDVIQVPKLLPHGLLHGVRVVEFQTPVYERLILSFRQKVLTQDGWDTEQALTLLAEPPLSQAMQQGVCKLNTHFDERVNLERIVEFDGFEVFRLSFLEAAELGVAELLGPVIGGNTDFGNILLLALHEIAIQNGPAELFLQPEEGACLPTWKNFSENSMRLKAKKGSIVLLSRPLS